MMANLLAAVSKGKFVFLAISRAIKLSKSLGVLIPVPIAVPPSGSG